MLFGVKGFAVEPLLVGTLAGCTSAHCDMLLMVTVRVTGPSATDSESREPPALLAGSSISATVSATVSGVLDGSSPSAPIRIAGSVR